MNGTVIVMLVKHITQILNESARVKEKRMLFFLLSIELIERIPTHFRYFSDELVGSMCLLAHKK